MRGLFTKSLMNISRVDLGVKIVGLVQNAKYSEVKREVPPLFFRPYKQDDQVGSMTFYVRTAVDADTSTHSGRHRGRPRSPCSGGIASTSGNASFESCRLAPVKRTASGTPRPSQIR